MQKFDKQTRASEQKYRESSIMDFFGHVAGGAAVDSLLERQMMVGKIKWKRSRGSKVNHEDYINRLIKINDEYESAHKLAVQNTTDLENHRE